MSSRYAKEPSFEHNDTPDRIAILLVNLGTPEAPTPRALRAYLKQFLSDPRVVEMPRALWWPVLLNILRTRAPRSAKKYAKIWDADGSPLKLHTEKQTRLLAGYIGHAGARASVEYAMRYGAPSIGSVLDRLHAEGHRRILVLPLYPQYAASTTATVVDEVCRWLTKARNQPEIRFVRGFADHPPYIEALAATIRRHWFACPPPVDGYRLIMSFHGIPQAASDAGDPYFRECQETARLLAQAVNLSERGWQITFQSRLGRARWLQPYTQQTLQRLAQDGVKRVDILCPSFVSDCLETLEEIAIENKAVFLAAGGREFNYIPCLNEDDAWIRCLVSLAEIHLAGWPVLEQVDPAVVGKTSHGR